MLVSEGHVSQWYEHFLSHCATGLEGNLELLATDMKSISDGLQRLDITQNKSALEFAASVANNTVQVLTIHDELESTRQTTLNNLVAQLDELWTCGNRERKRSSSAHRGNDDICKRPRRTCSVSRLSDSSIPSQRPALHPSAPSTTLRKWYLQNLASPYPDQSTKTAIAQADGIPIRKVEADLTNWRRRSGWTEALNTFAGGHKTAFAGLVKRWEKGASLKMGSPTKEMEFREAMDSLKRWVLREDQEKTGDWLDELQIAAENGLLPPAEVKPKSKSRKGKKSTRRSKREETESESEYESPPSEQSDHENEQGDGDEEEDDEDDVEVVVQPPTLPFASPDSQLSTPDRQRTDESLWGTTLDIAVPVWTSPVSSIEDDKHISHQTSIDSMSSLGEASAMAWTPPTSGIRSRDVSNGSSISNISESLAMDPALSASTSPSGPRKCSAQVPLQIPQMPFTFVNKYPSPHGFAPASVPVAQGIKRTAGAEQVEKPKKMQKGTHIAIDEVAATQDVYVFAPPSGSFHSAWTASMPPYHPQPYPAAAMPQSYPPAIYPPIYADTAHHDPSYWAELAPLPALPHMYATYGMPQALPSDWDFDPAIPQSFGYFSAGYGTGSGTAI